MKTSIQFLSNRIAALVDEDRGAEGLEKLLIVAAIVLPLLGILLFFKNGITKWVNESWTQVSGTAQNQEETGQFTPPTSGSGN